MLPITPLLPEVVQTLNHHATLVLTAPPGAGKTTALPLALLAAPYLQNQRILLLEPRRLAARAAAQRLAEQLGEPLGQTVGLRTRLERVISARTRLEVITEGVLTRQLLRDPALEGVGLVIFDEFHERSLEADLALALCRQARATLELPLRLLLMSATLEGERLAAWLQAPQLHAQGRSYPVRIEYLPPRAHENLLPLSLRGITQALETSRGDVLVFLPGGYEIRTLASRLGSLYPALVVCPLAGDLSRLEQDRALQADPGGRRRVVLATNIAQTSLTLAGISTVVDSGLVRVNRFDPNTGLGALVTEPISQASATQRAGRAGRLAPGLCYRLWSAEQHSRRAPHDTPEILRADLAPLALNLAAWGVKHPEELDWLDAPPAGAYQQAQDLLCQLGALDAQLTLTPQGQQLVQLPLHPRLARLLLAAAQCGQSELGSRLAALLGERDLLRGSSQRRSDVELRLAQLEHPGPDSDAYARTQILRTAQQLRRQLPLVPVTTPPLDVGGLLAYAYPERIAQRRAGTEPVYLLAQGRAAYLAADDPLAVQAWLVAAQVDQHTGKIQLAAALDIVAYGAQYPERIEQRETVAWDDEKQAIRALRSRHLGAIVLDSQPWNAPATQVLALWPAILRQQAVSLPWDEASRQWQARVLSLRQWLGHVWPDVADAQLLASLETWLLPYLEGMSKASELQRLALARILESTLDYDQQQRLAQLAPTHLSVPSGSRLPLTYHADARPPVLAVRLQELFGLQHTPTVAGGRIPVLLHLLSPGYRPVQVTQDLASFWRQTYPEVRKELKGRYPKHVWPDDPQQAQATARARPRMH